MALGLRWPSTWNPPRPGTEPISPALAGGFLTTGPPGEPLQYGPYSNVRFDTMSQKKKPRVKLSTLPNLQLGMKKGQHPSLLTCSRQGWKLKAALPCSSFHYILLLTFPIPSILVGILQHRKDYGFQRSTFTLCEIYSML